MTPEHYIATLLEKYRKAPDFPMENWAEDAVSFYAMINLWDDIFRTAAGEVGTTWRAVGDARMTPDSFLYHIASGDAARRLLITHAPEGGLFFVERSEEHKDTKLEIVCDVAEDRLIATFKMIRRFATAPPDDLPHLDAAFVEAYSDVFGFPDHDPFADAPDD